jgi:hypothetical protein
VFSIYCIVFATSTFITKKRMGVVRAATCGQLDRQIDRIIYSYN